MRNASLSDVRCYSSIRQHLNFIANECDREIATFLQVAMSLMFTGRQKLLTSEYIILASDEDKSLMSPRSSEPDFLTFVIVSGIVSNDNEIMLPHYFP